MLNEQGAFLRRQLVTLITRGESLSEAIEKIKAIAGNASGANKVDRTSTPVGWLFREKILPSDKNLEGLLLRESRAETTFVDAGLADAICAIERLAQSNMMMQRRVKVRLNSGLGYAILLLIISLSMFSFVLRPVITNFEEIYNSFGATLPSITQMVLQWTDGYLSFNVIYEVLLLLLLFTVIEVNRNDGFITSRWLNQLPLLRKSLRNIKLLHKLSILNIAVALGYGYKESVKAFDLNTRLLNKAKRYGLNFGEIEQAERVKTADAEIAYQLERFQQELEAELERGSQKLVLSVMFLVVIFIAVNLFGLYLPIFALGSAV